MRKSVITVILMLIMSATAYSASDSDYTMAEMLSDADRGDFDAMNSIGFSYYHGRGVAVDYAKAVYWFNKAIEGGSGLAMNNLAFAYLEGKYYARDNNKAFEWFKKSALADCGKGMFGLSYCYENGIGTAENPEKAYHWCLQAARLGEHAACGTLGDYLYSGYGIKKNDKLATLWYLTAIDYGSNASMYKLGVCYEEGAGVFMNSKIANMLYDAYETAESGNRDEAIDMVNRALALDKTDRCPHSLLSAYCDEWMEKGQQAYEQKEIDLARMYYELAANAGNTNAMINVGVCCSYDGHKYRGKEAIYWYNMAAEAGNPDGLYRAALYYDFNMQFETAWELMKKAAAAGSEKAKEAIKKNHSANTNTGAEALPQAAKKLSAGEPEEKEKTEGKSFLDFLFEEQEDPEAEALRQLIFLK